MNLSFHTTKIPFFLVMVNGCNQVNLIYVCPPPPSSHHLLVLPGELGTGQCTVRTCSSNCGQEQLFARFLLFDPSSLFFTLCSLFSSTCSLFLAPCYLLPAPCSLPSSSFFLLPAACCLLPAPCSWAERQPCPTMKINHSLATTGFRIQKVALDITSRLVITTSFQI